MKTNEAIKSTLSGKKLALYVAAVAAFCFLNCLSLDARNYKNPFSGKKFYEPIVVNEPQGIIPGTSNFHLNVQQAVINYVIWNRLAKLYSRTEKEVHARQESGEMIQLRDLYSSCKGKGTTSER